jgi:putative redox protein
MDMHVHHEGGDRYRVEIGTHALTVDQPDTGDAGPTPTDLFVASLASCVAHYAGRFFARHGVDPDGFTVDASFSMAADRPARVGRIDLRLRLPRAFPDGLRGRLAAVVDHCTVHNSITTPPDVRVELRTAAAAA